MKDEILKKLQLWIYQKMIGSKTKVHTLKISIKFYL